MIFSFVSPSVVSQAYTTDASKEYVISGNTALVKCVLPSYVADMLSVVNWVDNTGQTYPMASRNGNFQKTTGSQNYPLMN